MLKEDVNILIVDDDLTLGKAMAAILNRAGFKTVLVNKPSDAIAAAKYQQIHAAVVDCMLPKMNGRDLVKTLRTETSSSLPIIMMSGIYKDKNFIRDAMKSTGAVAFITKPFELEDFRKEIENALKDNFETPMERLQQFLSSQEIAAKDRIRAVDEADVVHGFDLPWIFSLLMHPKVSGHLNVISADNDVSGIAFSNGEIVQVFQEDLKSYFGALLVEHGFITQTDLDEAVKNVDPNATGKPKRMGERLIDANLISPHAIDVVMVEQQGLRLSKVVTDTSVKINFIETENIPVNAHTDRYVYTQLVNEWLTSKITRDWLKSYYTPWLHYKVKRGPEFNERHTVFSIPVLLAAPGICEALLESDSLDGAFERMGCTETDFYRALHALILSRMICFSEAESKADLETQRNRLIKLAATLDNQTFFERLGVSAKAKDAEIRRAFHELAKALHPDKLSHDTPPDIQLLAKQSFEKINEAYTTLIDPAAKTKYLTDLEKGRAESVLKAEELAESARHLLSKGDISTARRMLEQSSELAVPTSETRLMLMWARLKTAGADKEVGLGQKIKDDMAKIPPEDRHNTLFYFVKGLFMRHIDDIDSAKRNFDHVLAQDPEFIDARRELNSLNAGKKESGNLLNGDLKDVVGMFFRKKK